jgi:hypothetical protein
MTNNMDIVTNSDNIVTTIAKEKKENTLLIVWTTT